MTNDKLQPDQAAEILAVEVLSFLARDPERIAGFLAASGMGPEAVRASAREPGFLRGVIDHLLNDEPLLLVFCEETEYTSRDLWNARRVLEDMAPDE